MKREEQKKNDHKKHNTKRNEVKKEQKPKLEKNETTKKQIQSADDKKKTQTRKKTEQETLENQGPLSKKTKIKRKLNKKTMIIVILFGVFCFSTYKIVHFYKDLGENNKLNEELIENVLNTEVVANEEDKKLQEILTVDFEKLLNMNSDTKGWIRFNDNKVNNPVVQTTDNYFYLDHSFQKKSNSLGTLFIDHRNKSLEDQNVVIFGHNAVDDSMFGSLVNIFEKDFFDNEEHHKIEIIDTKGVSHLYEIFSFYVIEKEEYYITTSFSNHNEFQEFLNTIQNRSIKHFGVSLSTQDKVLTLSTCNGNGGTTKRTVIHAKKIS